MLSAGDARGPTLRFRRQVRILLAAVLKPHVRIGRLWRISRRRGVARVARLARSGLLSLEPIHCLPLRKLRFLVRPWNTRYVREFLSTVLTPTDSAPALVPTAGQRLRNTDAQISTRCRAATKSLRHPLCGLLQTRATFAASECNAQPFTPQSVHAARCKFSGSPHAPDRIE